MGASDYHPAARKGFWRDTATAAAQDDCDRILGSIAELAFSILSKGEALVPVAMGIRSDGLVTIVPSQFASTSLAARNELLAVLKDHQRLWRTVAIASDARLRDGRDALRVEIEHREGVGIDLFLPYAREANGLSVEAPIATEARCEVFETR